jgi:hypothetical protein
MGRTTKRLAVLLLGCVCLFSRLAERAALAQSSASAWSATGPTPASRETTAELTQDPEEPTELDVHLTSAMQPLPGRAAPVLSAGRGQTASVPRSQRPSPNRLASAPEMFGDFFMNGGDVNFLPNQMSFQLPPTYGSFTVPGAGGSRRVKISENNKALPTDRLIFTYNHFQNALQFTHHNLSDPAASIQRTMPIDRYTIGIEKTFLDGLWSAEVRMPFASEFGFSTPDLTGESGNIGNLAVIIKHLLVEDNDFAVVIGMGIDIPTGNDFRFVDHSPIFLNPPTRFVLHNDAVHLLPYMGAVYAPEEQRFFANGFVQVDLAANSNRVEAGPVDASPSLLGHFTEQNLLFVDLGTGYWIYEDDTGDALLSSLAAILEFHYTSALQDTDEILGSINGRDIQYRNNFNRFDIVNITAGLHARIGEYTNLRVAGVFPLRSRDDQRFFDSEVQVQVNRQF